MVYSNKYITEECIAWRTGHRPGTTPQQWAFARVNSFLTGGGARKADADLWSQAKKSKASKKEGFASRLLQTKNKCICTGIYQKIQRYLW